MIGDIEEGVIKVKKKWIYQQNYKSKVLVVYCILSQSKIVNEPLKNNNLWDGDYTKYVSFKTIDLNVRLGMLHSNNLIDVNAKYKVLEGVSIINIAIYNTKRYWLRDFLLKVKVNNIKLFTTVE